MNVSSVLTKYYENERLCSHGKNKPKQTQPVVSLSNLFQRLRIADFLKLTSKPVRPMVAPFEKLRASFWAIRLRGRFGGQGIGYRSFDKVYPERSRMGSRQAGFIKAESLKVSAFSILTKNYELKTKNYFYSAFSFALSLPPNVSPTPPHR